MKSSSFMRGNTHQDPARDTLVLLRQAQESLRESEDRHRRLANRMLALVFELDSKGNIISVNEAITKITGYEPSELNGHNWWEVFFPGDLQTQVVDLNQRLMAGDVTDYEISLVSKGKELVTLELTSANQYGEDGSLERIVGFCVKKSSRKRFIEEITEPAGKSLRIMGTAQDITEHHKTEQALRESEERYRLLVESVQDYAIFTLSPEGYVTSWNIGAERIKGYSAEEIVGEHFSRFYPIQAIAAGEPRASLELAAKDGRFDNESWRVRKDGSQFWASIVITALRDEMGRLLGFSKVVRDMSRRKEADEALRRQTGFVKLLQDVAIAANEAVTVNQALQFALDRVCDHTGWEVGHIYLVDSSSSGGLFPEDLWHLDDPEKFDSFRRATNETQFAVGTGLPGMVAARHAPVWIEDVTRHPNFPRAKWAAQVGLKMGVGFPVVAGKSIVGVLEFFSTRMVEPEQDLLDVMAHIGTQLGRVVERQFSEAALRRSEARFRTIFYGAPVGIELLDLDGQLLEYNPALSKILGYNPDLLLERGFSESARFTDMVVSSELLAALQDWNKDDWKQAPYHVERPYRRLDGQMVWGRLSVSIVRDDRDQPQFAIAMLEDITERKQMEADLAELQRRLTEGRMLERLQLAQELHDGPVQNLYGLTYHLKAFGLGLPEEVDSLPLVEIHQMLAHVVSTLRVICSDLRPPTLAPFGLEKAIQSHMDAIRETHPDLAVHIDLRTDRQELPERYRVVLFRIYQHLLINVLSHAEASQVWIRFDFDDHQVILEIQDNGKGFVVPEHWISIARQGHLGLAGSSDLAESIGGSLKVVSTPGEGTIVQVVVTRQPDQKDGDTLGAVDAKRE